MGGGSRAVVETRARWAKLTRLSLARADPLLAVEGDVDPGRFVRVRQERENGRPVERRLIGNDVIAGHAVLRRFTEGEEGIRHLDPAVAVAADGLAVAHAREAVREAAVRGDHVGLAMRDGGAAGVRARRRDVAHAALAAATPGAGQVRERDARLHGFGAERREAN